MFFVQHGGERGVMLQSQQPRGACDAALRIYQSLPHISGFVGVYPLIQIEVRPEIHEAANSSP
jgi:hypothetical protein